MKVNILVHSDGYGFYYVDVNKCMGADIPDECIEAYWSDDISGQIELLTDMKQKYPDHVITRI